MFLVKWLVMTVAVLAASYIIPGIEVADAGVGGFGVALIVALILGLVNIFIRPVLVLLTLPMTIMTLGLFLLVINAILLYFVAWLVNGFAIDSFLAAFIGSMFISIVSTLTSSLIKKRV